MSATKNGDFMKLSEKIADSIGIDAKYIEIIALRNNLYARYYIEKKNGGRREILQPSKELKVIQHWLVRNILNYFPVSKYSYAYSKGNSVRNNAMYHKKSKYILHTDIVNFFPSITRKMMLDYFKNNKRIVDELGINDEDIKLILDICLYKGNYLVIGGVASPRIANMIMYDFDIKLKEKLDCMGDFLYTRYADDIIISSYYYIDENMIEIVKSIMVEYGFEMNRKKTFFMNKKGKRQITGVVIDNNLNKLTIGNKRYKDFERMIYRYLVKNEGNIGYIKGYLAYIREINIEQYRQIERIYKKYDKKKEIFR